MSTAAPEPPTHLPGIDVLRAIACLWVVLFHVGRWWFGGHWYAFPAPHDAYHTLPLWLLHWFSRLGFHGVGLFLALSGFCLYYPLVRGRGVAHATLDLPLFARRRAERILPAYYASMLLLVVLAAVPATRAVVFLPITGLDIALHLVLAHNLHPATLWTMNGAYWSLGLEAQLYLIFPLLVALARRLGIGAIVALGFATSLAWMLVLRWALGQPFSPEHHGVLHESPPARLAEFSVGMAAAAALAEGRSVPRWLLVPLAFLWVPASHLVQLGGGFQLPWDRPFNALSFGALLLLAGQRPAEAWASPLPRTLAWIGGFSYSLYLVHQPLLLLLRSWIWQFSPSPAALALVGSALSIAAGWLFFQLFEGPPQRWLARRKKSLRGGAGSSRQGASPARASEFGA